MKLFDKKEERNKVGRPRLADEETKKKAIISVCIALVIVITLALTGAFKLNIIKFNKLKGVLNVNLCSEIPAKYQPRSESNPEGLYEYGFTDPKFYSAVVSTYNSDVSYCSTITEDQLKSITNLLVYTGQIGNADGIQYLTGLTYLGLYGKNLSSIDVSKNTALTSLNLSNNNLSDIDVSYNTNLTELSLSSNNLTDIDLSNNNRISSLSLKNNPNLKSIDLSGNTAITSFYWNANENEYSKLDSINVSDMTALTTLSLSGNNLTSIDVSQNAALISLNLNNNNLSSINLDGTTALKYLNLDLNNLSSIDVSGNPSLTSLNLQANNLEKIDLSNNHNISNLSLTGNSNLKSIDLSENIALKSFYYSAGAQLCSGNNKCFNNSNLESINVSNMSNLTELQIDSKSVIDIEGLETLENLTNLFLTQTVSKVDLSNLINLTSISLDKVKLDNVLDIRNLLKLENLDIYNTELSQIKLPDSDLSGLSLLNNNLSGSLDLSKYVNLEYISIYNDLNKLVLSDSNSLSSLILINCKMPSDKLDLSKYSNLSEVILKNNGLEEVIFGNNEQLYLLALDSNNLNKIDLSDMPNLNLLNIQNMPLLNTIYMLKGTSLKYNDNIILNEDRNPIYSIGDSNIVSYEEGKLKAQKEGVTSVSMSNENIVTYKLEAFNKCLIGLNEEDEEYCRNLSEEDAISPYFISQEVKVYDITSKEYKVDKDKKTIDALNKDFNASLINLTLNDLTGTLEDGKFIIKDNDVVVDTYKILNMKNVVNDPNNNNNTTTTTKKSGSNSKTTTKKKTTITEDLSDIEINGTHVSMLALQQIKGKDRNIVVKQDGITITINGKDIDKVNGNLDLSYELKVLKDSIIYNEVKDKINIGMVLSFKGNNNLPGKVLVSLDVTDNIKKNVGTRNLRLYSYKNGELTLVAENINPKDKKLSFYVNELGNYVLTDKELEGKEIKEDTKLLESNNKINQVISFKCFLWLIIILIILGIIGYVIYKKNKDKNN